MSLENLSIQELNALIVQAQKELERRKKTQKSSALAELKKVALAHGYDLAELLGGDVAVSSKEEKVRKPAKAKYRNSDDASQTWTGRGLKPKWLTAKIAQGATVESFLIVE